MVGLSAMVSGRVDRLELWELDAGVAAVWACTFSPDAWKLAHKIEAYSMTLDRVQATLAEPPDGTLELAFQTIIRNRAQRGGIMAPGAGLIKMGDGRGVASRWYPQTLATRIRLLSEYRHRVTARQGDGLAAYSRRAADPTVATFADPPYTAGGKRAGSRLYQHNEIDHGLLFSTAGVAAGPLLMTYDDCPEVQALAVQHGLKAERIPMKTGHHVLAKELVLTRTTP